MSVSDQSDPWAELRDLRRRIQRLESGTFLENSSITEGRMRFIGGTLRVDSGGRVEIVGYLSVEGTTDIIGPVTISGDLNITGPTTITGPTQVTGDLDVDGATTITGEFNLDGPWTISGAGDITGDVSVTGDFEVLGGGRIRVGNVVLTPGNGGRLTIGTGSSQIILDPSQFKVGPAFRMDPAHSDTGAQQEFGTNGRTTLYGEDAYAQLTKLDSSGSAVAWVRVGTVNDFTGVSIAGDLHLTPQPGPLPSGVTGKYLLIGSDGIVYAGSAGGGGDPGTPPAGNPDGYVWPADPAVYGISDDFAAHVARGSAEPGVDVMTPVGAALWAPGPGTVTAVQTSPAGATGRYVTLVTDAGDWFRFLHNSSIVVTVGQHVEQGQLLAYTGGSGFGSEAYYGPHSHISFKVGYTGSFPGASALDDFQAYMAAA